MSWRNSQAESPGPHGREGKASKGPSNAHRLQNGFSDGNCIPSVLSDGVCTAVFMCVCACARVCVCVHVCVPAFAEGVGDWGINNTQTQR